MGLGVFRLGASDSAIVVLVGLSARGGRGPSPATMTLLSLLVSIASGSREILWSPFLTLPFPRGILAGEGQPVREGFKELWGERLRVEAIQGPPGTEPVPFCVASRQVPPGAEL